MSITSDREDFRRFLAEYNFTGEQVWALSSGTNDRVPFPDWVDALRLQESDIRGIGMFAAKDVAFADVLAPARIGGKRTPAGIYTNHSSNSNVQYELHTDGDLDLIARRNIDEGEEVRLDYRQAAHVNGVSPNMDEVAKTLAERLSRLNIHRTGDELEKLAARAVARYGYLPSFPEFGVLLEWAT